MMRAKMQVVGVTKNLLDPKGAETVKMQPVSKKPYGDQGESEENTYARYTPSGSLELTITNPTLYGKFSSGQKFYLDFTEAAE